jgi:starch synthase
LLATIQEALAAYKDRAAWKKLMTNGMKKDFSWNVPAKEYERIYEGLRSTHGRSA